MLLFLNVIYVLLAIAMVALILMQRGSGAQAGAGFGGGASSTVFGARGASNFLSKSTKWLAIVFFAISLFMAWHATQRATGGEGLQDLGVMSQLPAVPAEPSQAPDGNAAVPAVPADAAPAPAADSEVPAVPSQSTPSQSPESASPEPAGD